METKEPERARAAAGKIGRLSEQTRGLMEDIKTWIDLKVELIEIQVEERIEAAANQVVFGVVLGVFAFLTLIFALVSGGLALGEWLDSAPLGFLALTGILAAITAVIYFVRPRMVRMRPKPAPEKAKAELKKAAEVRQLPGSAAGAAPAAPAAGGDHLNPVVVDAAKAGSDAKLTSGTAEAESAIPVSDSLSPKSTKKA